MRFLKFLRILVIAFFVWSIGGVTLHRYVPVPITPFMMRYCLSELYEWRLPQLAHKWVPMERISPHLKAAVIASEDQLFYCNQRGISTEDAVGLIVNGYAREVLAKLPMEFAVEAQKLLAISLEGSVG